MGTEEIFFSLYGLRWQDIVDILLNSYILFRLYVLFRGTYVFRVLLGLSILWFFQRVADSVGLILTSWAVQGVTAVAAFIIIVVFRNEIRSVLHAKTLKTILWGFPHETRQTPVEILSDALFDLSRKRIGALVVIPGKDDLEEIIQGGIRWNGYLTKEMLVSIFWPDNPVHDGAAVIDGDRVLQVGAILPLSRRNDLPPHYGTRHRAAIGLSEASDASVILVSEETGRVLVARNGEISIVTRRKDLALQVRNHLDIAGQRWGYTKQGRSRMVLAATFSVVAITAIWFSFTRGLESLATLEIPIEYMNRDPDAIIVKTSANKVRIDLSGSGPLLRSIRADQARVALDLADAVTGKNVINITRANVSLPPGVVLRDISPETVEVDLDIRSEKEVPVQVDWVGKLPENRIMTEVRSTPARVGLVGSSQILASISTVYTEKVRLDDLNRSGAINAQLLLRPSSVSLAPEFGPTVKITYVLTPRQPRAQGDGTARPATP
jgi:uncharacterized protein (TIGR00159 family)